MLQVGSVILTILPNYLRDPTISQRLKVQIQTTGPNQVAEAFSATLHQSSTYQLAMMGLYMFHYKQSLPPLEPYTFISSFLPISQPPFQNHLLS